MKTGDVLDVLTPIVRFWKLKHLDRLTKLASTGTTNALLVLMLFEVPKNNL